MGARNRPEMPYGWGRVPYTLNDRLKWMNLPFEVSEYQQRLERLRQQMVQNGLDVVVVVGNRADNSNVRYLSNFEDFYGGESIVVVPAAGNPGFTTNAIMHGEPMHSGIQDCWIEDVRCAAAPRTVTGNADAVTIFDHVEDFIRESGLTAKGKIGLVGEFNVDTLEAFLKDRFPDATVKHTSAILYGMRAIKSPAEIALMRKACHLADAGLSAAMNAVRPGVSEFDLSAEANYAMFKAGSEHPAFAIAVAAGPRSGFKHVAPTNNRVSPGDMVYVDLGGRYMGYYSDCSRQRVCGEPTAEQLRFMETQIKIVEEVTKAARPGAVIADLAEIGIKIARDAGYEQYLYFRGHGIGCATHDLPSFAPGNPKKLEENMVFCFEPMLVKYEFGTACWEDIWWVTSNGVQNLNECPIRFW
jgi:Xaa-Pro aminopeptidase